jgi:hypothetical protein
MSLTVVTPATSFNLTTLPRAKLELSISSTDSSKDGYLKAAISEASDMLAKETNRVFAKQTYLEILPGTNRNSISLRRFPLVSVDKVVHQREYGTLSGDWFYEGEIGDFIGVASTLTTSVYRIEDAESGIVYKKSIWYRQPTIVQNINAHIIDDREPYQITYKAGWVLPSTLTSSSTAYAVRTLPYDLERAALTLVTGSYMSIGRDPNIVSQRTGDAQEQMVEQPRSFPIILGMPQSVYRVVERYRVTL